MFHASQTSTSSQRTRDQYVNRLRLFPPATPASRTGDKLERINGSQLVWRHSRGLSPNLPRGLAPLRATGPASVHRGRIGPAGPRGADWQAPRGPLPTTTTPSAWRLQGGDAAGISVNIHTYAHRKRCDDVGAPAAAAMPAKKPDARASHGYHTPQPRVMSRYRPTLFGWQRGDCLLKRSAAPRAPLQQVELWEIKNCPSFSHICTEGGFDKTCSFTSTCGSGIKDEGSGHQKCFH